MKFDSQARYLPTHEWARREGEDYVCGVSDVAQDALGDVVFVDLPHVGDRFRKGEVLGVIESVKAANDLYAPLTGVVTAVHAEINDHPERVNSDPYGDGWLVRMRAEAPGEWEELLDAAAYEARS